MQSLWLGQLDYGEALQLQRELSELVQRGLAGDTLLLLEHPRTITLGRGADRANLLLSAEEAARTGVAIWEADRGGDVTYHGPGQLVGYPILDLSRHRKDVHWYLREVEGALIEVLAGYGIEATRFPPHTGVWAEDRKIAAIGVKVSRWVTTHGFALNVTTRAEDFGGIVPCGIREYGVTSMRDVTGTAYGLETVAAAAARSFSERFPGSLNWAGEPPGLSESSKKILAQALDMAPGVR